MFVIGITPRVHAGFAPSEGLVMAPGERTADLGKIQKFLEMKVVRERLRDLGFTSEEIQSKIKDLNDQQLHQLALKVDELKVAGDGAGIVIGLIIIALLVVVIIYLSGHRVVVK
jgi:tetrahydromethanopterin S-methyltransferase subunit B